jgi:hypothetical protein
MPTTTVPSARQVQAAQNQRLFRILNDNLRLLPRESAGPYVDASVCECADSTCTDPIAIDPQAYGRLREHARQFAVAADHVFLDVEHVVAWEEGYWIVEKPASAVAAADHDALPADTFRVER